MAAAQLAAIRDKKAHRPFEPFRIVTTTGSIIPVLERFQLAVSENRVLCFLQPEKRRFVELTADQIASVEKVEIAPSA